MRCVIVNPPPMLIAEAMTAVAAKVYKHTVKACVERLSSVLVSSREFWTLSFPEWLKSQSQKMVRH